MGWSPGSAAMHQCNSRYFPPYTWIPFLFDRKRKPSDLSFLHVQCFTQKWGEGAPLTQTLSQLGEGLDQGISGSGVELQKGAETSPVTAQHPSLLEAMRGPVPNLFLMFWEPFPQRYQFVALQLPI